MTEIFVQRMPPELLSQLKTNGCTRPKHCYANCALAVGKLNLCDAYVLCFVQRPGSERTGHALIKLGDDYYDPTLEPQQIADVRYWLHTEFSKHELRKFMIDWHKNLEPKASPRATAHPPILRDDGTIVCED